MSTPMHVRREQRLAATLAKRGTPEWRQGGLQLLAEQAQAKADAAHRRAEAQLQRKLAADRAKPVTDRELAKAVAEVQACIEDAVADTGLPADTVAWDIVTGQVAYMRPALAAEVRRVLL
jgi:hypothetical protein